MSPYWKLTKLTRNTQKHNCTNSQFKNQLKHISNLQHNSFNTMKWIESMKTHKPYFAFPILSNNQLVNFWQPVLYTFDSRVTAHQNSGKTQHDFKGNNSG